MVDNTSVPATGDVDVRGSSSSRFGTYRVGRASGSCHADNNAVLPRVAIVRHALVIILAAVQLVCVVLVTYDLVKKGHLSVWSAALMAACSIMWGVVLLRLAYLFLRRRANVAMVLNAQLPTDPLISVPASTATAGREIGSRTDRLSEVQNNLHGVQAVSDIQPAGHVILTASYLGRAEDHLSASVGPGVSASRVVFHSGGRGEILCVIGREVFKVRSWAIGRVNPMVPGCVQIILRPIFPQDMSIARHAMYFKRNGAAGAEPMHLLKVRVTTESLLSIMFESGIYTDCVGSSESLRHYVEFYSRLLLRCLPGSSGDSAVGGEVAHWGREDALRCAGRGLLQMVGSHAGIRRFVCDIITHRRAFERLVSFGSITRLEKAFIGSCLNSTAECDVAALGGNGADTSREFVSALYAITCTYEQFFKNLDDTHRTRLIISKFLADKDFRTVMVARTINAVHNAIYSIKRRKAQITLDAIISHGCIEESLPYLCRWMPALFESVSAVLLINSYGLTHMQDLDASIVRWLAVIPGFEVINTNGVVEVLAKSTERGRGITPDSEVDTRFLTAIEIISKTAEFNAYVPSAAQALYTGTEDSNMTRPMKTLQTPLARLNPEGLRAIVAFAVACEIADLLPDGQKCSLNALREIIGPEISSRAMLRILENAGQKQCGFFTSLISDVVYVRYPSLDRELVGVRFPAVEETSSIDVTTETSVETPYRPPLQNL
ncbi:hypothetical protein BKM88_02110 [Anaplasma marginale]|uniref:hypothetical protein n=1 Tax=Anaplasma marginale TaxID=770 RepID=UPI000E58CC3A|nr:hypothetical protein [Anaplasma marginale]AXW84930.1 hypothetical protein BKM88_02110 [Anaplasma marginale]